MIDIKKLRENFSNVQALLKKRGYDLNEESFKSIDEKRKTLKVEVEKLQSDIKKNSIELFNLKAADKDTSKLKETIDLINTDLEQKDLSLQELMFSLNNLLLDIPNIPDESVPEGISEEENKVISQHGSIDSTNKLNHLEITKKIDIDLAAKLSGSRFAVLKGDLSKLQRSLITFMLDTAIKNGYEEYYVPFMANEESLIGTGQLCLLYTSDAADDC